MKTNLTKREFLQLSSAGGVAAFLGLLAGTTADARKPPTVDILAELAESITPINYIGGLAFAVAAIVKFKQHKDNPTQDPRDALGFLSAVWALIDDPTVTSLTALGYSPQFLVDAVEEAKDGDNSSLIAFFADLNDLP